MGLRPFYGKKEKELALCNMAQLDILELKDRCYRDLSGGQQQRVLLARALCATQKLLLLDEPVAGLDPNATLEMYNTISALNQKGITIIMISHDINSALFYSTHILHIGKSIFFGTRDEYISSKESRAFTEKEAVYA
jgi:zinc transport system ATP-binding protein